MPMVDVLTSAVLASSLLGGAGATTIAPDAGLPPPHESRIALGGGAPDLAPGNYAGLPRQAVSVRPTPGSREQISDAPAGTR